MGRIKHLIKIVFVAAVLLLGKAAVAQSIQGVVKNQEATTLDNVSVIVKNSDNKTITYAFTKNNGSFTFENLEKQIYTLQINTLGYEKQILTVDLTQEFNKKIEVVLTVKENVLNDELNFKKSIELDKARMPEGTILTEVKRVRMGIEKKYE